MDSINSANLVRTSLTPQFVGEKSVPDESHVVKDQVILNNSPEPQNNSPVPFNKEEIKEKIATVAEAAHVAAEIGRSAELTGVMGAITGIGGIAGGLYLGVDGVREMKHAIHDKNVEHIAEAAGNIALGAESIGEAAIMASKTAVGASIMGPLASAIAHSGVFETALTTFGIVHVGVEGVFAGREIVKGIKTHDKKKITSGAINLGMSLAIAGVILGAGLPAGIALGGLFAAKVIHNRKQIKADVMHIFNSTKENLRKAFS